MEANLSTEGGGGHARQRDNPSYDTSHSGNRWGQPFSGTPGGSGTVNSRPRHSNDRSHTTLGPPPDYEAQAGAAPRTNQNDPSPPYINHKKNRHPPV
jgi:hypothetical protein